MTQQMMQQVAQAIETAGYRTEIDASEGEIVVFNVPALTQVGRIRKIANSFDCRARAGVDGTVVVTAR